MKILSPISVGLPCFGPVGQHIGSLKGRLCQTWLRLPDRSAPESSSEGSSEQCSPVISGSILAGLNLVLRLNVSPGRFSFGDSNQEGPSIPGSEGDSPPLAKNMQAVSLAPVGEPLIDLGLSIEVIETILHARAPSMRNLYTLRWHRLYLLMSAECITLTQSTACLVKCWRSCRSVFQQDYS